MRKKKTQERFILNEIKIESTATLGRGIARHEGMVIFVDNAVPGDVSDIEIFNKKKNLMEGKTVFIHSPSPSRVKPECVHFGVCGGCKWQHMDYSMQLKIKDQSVKDNLERIGKLEFPEPEPILASENIYYYRNRLDFAFSSKRWLESADMNTEGLNLNALGFHIPGRFDKILDISHCHLQGSYSNEIRLAVKQFAFDNGMTFFDPRTQEGFLRSLIIRNAGEKELMVILIFTKEDSSSIQKMMNFISEKFPVISSLIWFVNSKRNDTIYDLDYHVHKGNEFIIEEMEGLKFKVGPKSFFQTNSKQAYHLYSLARDFAGFKGHEVVYDLYTGTGTIALFISKSVQKVVGIESVPEAIEDAKNNAILNGIQNASFFSGDMKDILTPKFIEINGKPDVIITDPPRVGMHEKVVSQILDILPGKIVYISCNPATQARDLALLNAKYKIVKSRAVDMFPHTEHVENVVLLIARD